MVLREYRIMGDSPEDVMRQTDALSFVFLVNAGP